MKLILKLNQFKLEKHKGHLHLLQMLLEEHRVGLRSNVYQFLLPFIHLVNLAYIGTVILGETLNCIICHQDDLQELFKQIVTDVTDTPFWNGTPN